MTKLPQIVNFQWHVFDRMRELGVTGIIMINGNRAQIVPPYSSYFRYLKACNDDSPQI
jgi:hypothetical protein